MKRRAFTLTELLTVVGVIGLLLSVVVASYPSVFATARRITCANNLHQLYTLVRLTRNELAENGEHTVQNSDFLHTIQWPERVYQSGDQKPDLFLCDSAVEGVDSFDEEAVHGLMPSVPTVVYRSGMYKNVYVPFDPNEFLCVSRRGVDEHGEPYVEYCVEENAGVEAKWEYALPGHPEFSTNDGIWRVYNEGSSGRRRMILVHYDCGWPNELYVNGEKYGDTMYQLQGMTIYFNDYVTSYGYNALLQYASGVSGDTIVLLDYADADPTRGGNAVHADPNDPDIDANLDAGARHNGKLNVLFAHGGVETREPLDLYPQLDGAPWTPEADAPGTPLNLPAPDDGDAPGGTDLDEL
jgi:prepilin-type N-terminal cleavage/methylation domain-containing protein